MQEVSKEAEHPATRALLREFRDELKADIRSVENRVDSLELRMESRFDNMDGRLHRMQQLLEEQRGDNRIVLEALKGFVDRQSLVEQKVDSVVDTVKWLASCAPKKQPTQ